MRLAGSGEVFNWLRMSGFDEIGNTEFGDRADRAAEGGAVHDAAKMFVLVLGQSFPLGGLSQTVSHAKTEPQESRLPPGRFM